VNQNGLDQYGSGFDKDKFDPQGLEEEDKIGKITSSFINNSSLPHVIYNLYWPDNSSFVALFASPVPIINYYDGPCILQLHCLLNFSGSKSADVMPASRSSQTSCELGQLLSSKGAKQDQGQRLLLGQPPPCQVRQQSIR